MELIVPQGKQAYAIRYSDARINIWDGAVRSGKTFASIWRWVRYVREGPPGELLMAGKTERTLKRNILDPIAELVGNRNFRLVSGSGECWLFGRRIYLVGANDERAEGKIRGMTLAGAYGDEVTLWPESFFTMLLSRLSVPGAQFFGTTNPDSPGHWLKRRYLDRADELSLRRFRFTLADNPALDPAYVEALKREYTGLWYRRYVLGEWVAAEGAIYDMFDPDRHVARELPEILHWWVGVDYGTTNPFVAVLLGEGIDRRLYVVDEWRWDSRQQGRQMTDAEYSRALQRWLSEYTTTWRWIFVDPSAASFIVQLHRDRVRGVTGANNDVLDGIRNVATLLATDRLKIHSRCTGLIEELQSYAWDDKAQAQGEDKPLKQNDHGPDALRYVCAGTQSTWKRWLRSEPGAKQEAA